MKLLRGKTLPALAEAVFLEPQWRTGAHICLIVPDRFSLEAETALAAHTNNGVCFDREVTTFARLVGALAPDGRVLGKEGSVMAVAAIMNRLGARLGCLPADRAGKAAGEVYATIAQLMASDLAPADLDVPAEGALARKLADLALIYREYLGFLAGGFRDPDAAMFAAIRALPHAEAVRDTYYFVLGFDSLTRVNLRFVRELDRCSRGVTVAAVDAAFHFGAPTLCGAVAPFAAQIADTDERLSPLGAVYWRTMDADAPDPTVDLPRDGEEEIEIFCADSRRDGAKFLAERVFAAVREDGLRWRDVAVVAADPAKLANVFSEFRIPVNCDETLPLALHPLARLCLSALECVVTRFADAAVRKLAFNPLGGVSARDYAIWDNYTLRFGISHAMHLSPYKATAKEDVSGEETAVAERVRRKIVALVADFPAENAEVAVFADACRALIARFAQRADVWHRVLEQRGEEAYAEFGGQAEGRLTALLDNLAVVGDGDVSAEEFLRLLNAGALAAELRVAPAYADAVNLFTPDSFGFRTYRRLFWYGADEGELPARSADCGLISDAEIDVLSAVGAAVDPKIEEINARARYRLFATMFLAPKLTVICHGEAVGAHPDCFVRALDTNVGVPVMPVRYATEDEYLSDAARRDAYRIAVTPALAAEEFLRLYRLGAGRGAAAVSPAAAALSVAGGVGAPKRREYVVAQARELFFGRGKTSVSQIERYFDCPYMHFVYYGLRCKDRKVAEVKANDIGNFLHAVAEKFAPALPARREDCAARAAEIVAELVANDELFGLDTDAVRLMRKRLDREAALLCEKLYDFAAATDFVCVEAEKEFGGGDYPALAVGREAIGLGGRIDRIDRLPDDDRVMIVDYKTGKASFDLKDVYFGKQLQLFAYMRVLTRGGARPAAALFFPVNNDYGEEKCCGGWVSADPDTLTRLDRNLDCEHCRSRFLPVNLNKTAAKKGEWKLTASERALSAAEWETWLAYTEAVAANAADELCDGYIEPRPLSVEGRTPCRYCAARGACDPEPRARVHNERAGDLRPNEEERDV